VRTIDPLTRMLLVAFIASAAPAEAQTPKDDARSRLLAAKTALYDSNFRNDARGLRDAIGRSVEIARDHTVRPLALYYATWGEWVLSHSQMQAGDMTAAAASLNRGEEHARAALALRPDDPEFIVMLADVLIWRAMAEPARMGDLAPEIRTLRTRALELAPNNPRAIIMDAGLVFNNPPERGGSREQGLARWERALQLFDREAEQPVTDELRPDWGRVLAYGWAADLYLAMRPRQLDRARIAAAKALQLRPDFWYVNEVVMPRLGPPDE
jgi:hypothetical protein